MKSMGQRWGWVGRKESGSEHARQGIHTVGHFGTVQRLRPLVWACDEVSVERLDESFLVLGRWDDRGFFAGAQALLRFIFEGFGEGVAACKERSALDVVIG